MKNLSLLLGLAGLLILSSCTQEVKTLEPSDERIFTRNADLVAKVTYKSYKRVYGLEPFDALEMGKKKDSPKIEYIVTFRLVETLKGDYYTTGQGEYFQVRKAGERVFMRIGTQSPLAFGIDRSTEPAEKLYTIYLKYYPEGSGYYRVIGSSWDYKDKLMDGDIPLRHADSHRES